MSPCPVRTSIDRHFEGTISPRDERRMREHLPACESCHEYYERHLVLARLDPAALPAEGRVGKGLGFGRRRFATVIPLGVIGTLAAAAALMLVVRSGGDPNGFSARGNVSTAPASRVVVYDVQPGKAPILAGETIGRHDELAFAYENGAAKSRLMVFGLDEHRHVYWFYPAWTRESDNPVAVPIERGASRRELPEAVSQALDGALLEVHALFVDQPISVREVETLVRTQVPEPSASAAPPSPLPIPGAVESTVSFVVIR
jgi:Putative zinc-finger